jgi:glycosyltransferase involved in cell wall biosynthesis
MGVFCVCVVRDEADIIRHTLDAALGWAEGIYIVDNGSTDGTWELLQTYAERFPKVVLLERELGPYRHSLWGEIANRFLINASARDWWCRLDADEIYVDDPRDFLSRIPAREKIVWSLSIQYYFTDIDVAAYERNPTSYTKRWHPGRLRYYQANWSEPRFVRHVLGRRWEGAWPEGFYEMRSARKRIRLKHFQYRSPPQIQHRLRLRLSTGAKAFRHEKTEGWLTKGLTPADLVWPDAPASDEELWRSRIVRATALDRNDENNQPHVNPRLLPAMWGRPSLLRRAIGRISSLSKPFR